MEVFLIVVAILGLGIFGMCFNIIFRKKDFPHYEVGDNEEMRKLGIRCYKDEDAAIHAKKCTGNFSDACKECKLYESGSNSRKA